MTPRTVFTTYLMNGPNNQECSVTLGWKRPARDKHVSLLGPCVSYKEDKHC